MKSITPDELVKLTEKHIEYDTPNLEAFERGYGACEERMQQELSAAQETCMTVVSQLNETAGRLASIEPLFKKLLMKGAAPLLGNLEKGENKESVICIGEQEYTYPAMAKMIRNWHPLGLKYLTGWLDAEDYVTQHKH